MTESLEAKTPDSVSDLPQSQDKASLAVAVPPAVLDRTDATPGLANTHDLKLAINALGAMGVKRVARSEATQALLDEGFGSVEEARSALTTLGSQIWCAAVLEGMRHKNPTIRRTAMQSFERAARIGGADGALVQTFVLQFGLGSLDDVRAVLDQARSSRDAPPEQTDRDCIEWLEARGFRVARMAQAVEQAPAGAAKEQKS